MQLVIKHWTCLGRRVLLAPALPVAPRVAGAGCPAHWHGEGSRRGWYLHMSVWLWHLKLWGEVLEQAALLPQCPLPLLPVPLHGPCPSRNRLGMSRAVHAPSALRKRCHQKPSPTLTRWSGEEDVHRGGRGIKETIIFPEAPRGDGLLLCTRAISPLEGKAEEIPSPGMGWPWLPAPGCMDPVGLRVLSDPRREGSWPPPPQGHPRGRHTSPPALAGCRPHQLWRWRWTELGQPCCQPPACLGLPKSSKRMKILTGLVPSCQNADVMQDWVVSAATTRIWGEEGLEKRGGIEGAEQILVFTAHAHDVKGHLGRGWQFVVLTALSNSH